MGKYYKAVKFEELDADMTEVANVIRAKIGSNEPIRWPDGYKEAIANLSSVKENDVNFYDYDGTLLYSYTLEEAKALTSLPSSAGVHEGLSFIGWNWTLEAVQSLSYPMDIGALYETTDGGCWLFIDLQVPTQLTQEIHFNQTASNCVRINWGDGSESESPEETGQICLSHTYADLGRYIIKIYATARKCRLGADSNTMNIFGDTSVTHNRDILYKLYMTSGFYVLKYCFSYCCALETATMPRNTVDFHVPERAFSDCYNLKCAVLPNAARPTTAYSFYQCYSLRTVCAGNNTQNTGGSSLRRCYSLKRRMLPSQCSTGTGYDLLTCYGLQEASGKHSTEDIQTCANCASLQRYYFSDSSTGIPKEFFKNCYSLTELDIPAAVTTIGAYAFQNCYSLNRLRFNSEEPPVADANAFSGISSACVIEVPVDFLACYQTATNYGSIVAQMIGV